MYKRQIPAPMGLKYAGNKDLPYYFAWQAPSNDIESYNVYVNGTLVESTVATAINLKGEVFNSGSGDYIVSVKAVKNGKTDVYKRQTKTPVTEAPTVAPTTKNETTAAGQPELKPTEVISLTIQEQKAGKVTYVWGQTQEQIASGQTYKVYIEDVYKRQVL